MFVFPIARIPRFNKCCLGREEFGEESRASFLFGDTYFLGEDSVGLPRERPSRDGSIFLCRVQANQGRVDIHSGASE